MVPVVDVLVRFRVRFGASMLDRFCRVIVSFVIMRNHAHVRLVHVLYVRHMRNFVVVMAVVSVVVAVVLTVQMASVVTVVRGSMMCIMVNVMGMVVDSVFVTVVMSRRVIMMVMMVVLVILMAVAVMAGVIGSQPPAVVTP